MLEQLKLMLNIKDTDKDPLLMLLLNRATQFVMNYTHNDSLPELEAVIVDVAVIDYNRMGSQGASSESYSGISYTYESDYPPAIYRQMQAYRKVRFK